MLIADIAQATGGALQCLFPAGLAECTQRLGRVDIERGGLGRIVAPDQWPGQALAVMHVVKPVASLDTQPLVVGRSVTTLDIQDPVVPDLVGQLAADTAIGTDRVDLPVRHFKGNVAGGHQGAGRAGLYTLAAGDAGTLAHRVVEIEDDVARLAPAGISDDAVDLLLAAGAQAAGALDAGLEIDRDGRMREVGHGVRAPGKARRAQLQLLRPVVQFIVAGVAAAGHVGLQQFKDQAL